ncbi:G2/mitotic-specific cyclin 2 [Nematocida sp. LUAm3]|nr:G2/mitotic-specific cyclin 2 [Nematocida sp. LUAm3]
MRVTDENKSILHREKQGERRALGEVQNRRRMALSEHLEIEDLSNVRVPGEYVESILKKYQEVEVCLMPNPEYMRFQEELRWAMRTVLVEWIIDVHCKLNLLPETLYLAINLIDRFLSARVVSIGKLQLVGVSGVLVASKFQEVSSPSIETFVVLTDRSFTENEILRAEKYMLHCLEYRIDYPSPLNWLRRCSRSKSVEWMANILLDISLLDEQYISYVPSIMGSACSYVAHILMKSGELDVFYHFCRYPMKTLSKCILSLKKTLSRRITHESIFKKHGSSFTKYLENIHSIYIDE